MNDSLRRSSPLDRELTVFLQMIDALPDGYRTIAHPPEFAERAGWPVEFTIALFDSARGRGLIVPFQPRRNVTRWRLSTRGREWLTARASSMV
jgi:hypothetical protein